MVRMRRDTLAVLAALRKAPLPLTPRDIASRTDVPPDRVAAALELLVATGPVIRVLGAAAYALSHWPAGTVDGPPAHEHVFGRYIGVQTDVFEPPRPLWNCRVCHSTLAGPAAAMVRCACGERAIAESAVVLRRGHLACPSCTYDALHDARDHQRDVFHGADGSAPYTAAHSEIRSGAEDFGGCSGRADA